MDEYRSKNIEYIGRKFDYLPLFIIIIYLSVSYIAHLIMNDSKSVLLLLFVAITHICIIIGYILPSNSAILYKYPKTNKTVVWKYNKSIEKIIIISMFITIFGCIYNVFEFYAEDDNIINFLINPGKGYEYVKFLRNNPEYNISNNDYGSIISIFLTLSSGTKYIYLMLSLLFWKDLKKKFKLLFYITSGIYLINSLLIGAMITVAGPLMACMPIIINSIRSKRTDNNVNKSEKKWKRQFLGFLVLLITILLIVFFIGNRVDENSSMLEGFRTLIFYFSHGYIGLEESIELPFEFTCGFTTFRGITMYFVKYMGIDDPFVYSYLMRNEAINGWPALSLWSTIYPWLASDFTFFLIPLIMGSISYVFSKIWNRTLVDNNPFSYLLLGQFFVFWLMVPANNQLFLTLGNASSLILILYLYRQSQKV
ncbi:MAG: hypothetical protein AB9883_05600 [Acidaminococcaceae bacterium]